MRIRSLAVALLLAGACSRQAPQPADSPHAAAGPPKAPVSGIELTAMDDAVRVQDDLFAHVNGAWLARTQIPPDTSSYGSFDLLFDQSQVDLRAIAEELSKSADRRTGSDAQEIGDFYGAFMDETRANTLGLQPAAPELAAIDALATKSDLARHLARMFKMNLLNPLVGYVDGDAKDPKTDTSRRAGSASPIATTT